MQVVPSLAIRAVMPGEEPAWSEAMALYQRAIEPAEQRPVARLAQDLLAGRERLFVGCDEAGAVRAFTVLATLADGSALMDYLAVDEHLRGGGIGSRFVAHVLAMLRQARAPRLLIEVDDADHAADPETCRRRARFYTRLGARRLAGLTHRLPSSLGPAPVMMQLYAIPLAEATPAVAGATLEAMWRFIYQELYDRPLPDPLLEQALADLPASVPLEPA